MANNLDNVSEALKDLLPLSVIGEIASFVLYDEFPRDTFTIDITICTHAGLVQEYYKRELTNSILLENVNCVSEIRILRNSKGDFFYLVSADEDLVLISRKNTLNIHNRITNIDIYEIEDSNCRGYAFLKVYLKDDAVPLVFDDNFDKLSEKPITVTDVTSEESLPIISQLMTKLTEAKYTTNCNENTLKEYLNLRQAAAFSIYQRVQPNLDDSILKLNRSEISNALQIKTQTPIVMLCNRKIVIITNIFNKNTVPISNITILLHGITKQSITYTTKLFEETPQPPHWKEKHSQIDNNESSAAVAVIDLKEIKDNVLSGIDLDIVVSYIKDAKPHFLPLESVKISTLDTMGEDFDVLCGNTTDTHTVILSILATAEQTDLSLRLIQNHDELVTPFDLFCQYLKMDQLAHNVAIHKIAPHHILYGVMVVVQDNIKNLDHVVNIQVYSRCQSQVLALIHYMHDAFPFRIIATTRDLKISALTKKLSKFSEDHEAKNVQLNYKDYGTSFYKQATAIKEYFDNCMISMSENKNIEIRNKVGFEVDLLAQGLPKYLKFRSQLLDESLNGVKGLSFEEVDDDSPDITIIND